MKNNIKKNILLIMLAGALAVFGCGQKGPLYLEKPQEKTQKSVK